MSFFQKYGDIKVKFASYHKYVFTFEGVTEEGDTLKILAGGDSDDIYRANINRGLLYYT